MTWHDLSRIKLDAQDAAISKRARAPRPIQTPASSSSLNDIAKLLDTSVAVYIALEEARHTVSLPLPLQKGAKPSSVFVFLAPSSRQWGSRQVFLCELGLNAMHDDGCCLSQPVSERSRRGSFECIVWFLRLDWFCALSALFARGIRTRIGRWIRCRVARTSCSREKKPKRGISHGRVVWLLYWSSGRLARVLYSRLIARHTLVLQINLILFH